jgi:hypothetical protein
VTGPETSAAGAVVNLICVKVAWRGRTIPSVEHPFHVIEVNPEPAHPKGRKGLVLASAWRQMATPADVGMLLLDSDVAIEPTDLGAMISHVGRDTTSVWTAPAKLWPRSTHLPSWVWGHRKEPSPGATGQDTIRLWQTDVDDPDWFTFCFTYLPRRLVDAAVIEGLKEWHYPYVDLNMHRLAKRLGIPVRVVRGDCHPKHINF